MLRETVATAPQPRRWGDDASERKRRKLDRFDGAGLNLPAEGRKAIGVWYPVREQQ